MGDHNISLAKQKEERASFIRHLLDDVSALEYMLENDLIEQGITRIGAEQEFCIVDQNWEPSQKSLAILNDINDPHFTTEIARYNLEINLDPLELKGNCFSTMHAELKRLLNKAANSAKKLGDKVILTGILPTISKKELHPDYMTPNPRYWALNESIKKRRGTDFELHLKGVDELTVHHDSVLFEACNTSFQLHLQISPEDFVSSYNWAQAISGPLLGVCTNSPLLMGRELWNETRIALFQQSIDTRMSAAAIRNQEARVSFRNSWCQGTAADIFKDDIGKFNILISDQIEEDALAMVQKGKAPKLRALNLFNGTVYRWNRACYGTGKGKAHLRIENRYIPSGPSTLDEMANFAFWVGLMTGRPSTFDDMPSIMDFKDAKHNFLKAARSGKASIMSWCGEEHMLKDLVLKELLPIAHTGLKNANIPPEEIEKYLAVIAKRVKGQDGSTWLIKNYRNLRKSYKNYTALKAITKASHIFQNDGVPVHNWPDVQQSDFGNIEPLIVRHAMSTEILTVSENDMADLATSIMKWNSIHHVPVESSSGKLAGLLTWSHIEKYEKSKNDLLIVNDIMVKEPVTIDPNSSLKKASNIMISYQIGCLPVIDNGILVGIITKNDLSEFVDGESI